VGKWRLRSKMKILQQQFFAVREKIGGQSANTGCPQGPAPARQSRVGGVGKPEWQRRRFDVAVAKDHVGFDLKVETYLQNPVFSSGVQSASALF
jgi:hypothetical protein